ncbi:MAG TPA: hypothetical protein VJ757_05795 [Pseudonocardiaceae bacterium]|nr:hypothetical protein [Pseudonocardiaceae bacterium]
MSTGIVIVLAVGVAAIVILGALGLLLIARLRRTIKTQFKALDDVLNTMRASQGRDEPGEGP